MDLEPESSAAGHEDTPVKRAREAQGLTQRDVAERSGVDQSQLSKIEKGKGSGSVNTLYRIFVTLNMRREVEAYRPYLTDRTLLDHSTWLNRKRDDSEGDGPS